MEKTHQKKDVLSEDLNKLLVFWVLITFVTSSEAFSNLCFSKKRVTLFRLPI